MRNKKRKKKRISDWGKTHYGLNVARETVDVGELKKIIKRNCEQATLRLWGRMSRIEDCDWFPSCEVYYNQDDCFSCRLCPITIHEKTRTCYACENQTPYACYVTRRGHVQSRAKAFYKYLKEEVFKLK